jgi:hypothetical protein
MRSVRGLCAAISFLLVVPLALLGSIAFGIDAELTVHFVAAVGFALLALAVFDFQTPRWLTLAACVAASISAGTYLLQGISNLVPNDALHYVAFQVLGQQLERVLPDVLMVWFLGLLLTASHGKTRLLGFAVVVPVELIELASYGLSVVGGSIYDGAPLLKAALLLPFVWLALESAKITLMHRSLRSRLERDEPIRVTGVVARWRRSQSSSNARPTAA